MMFMNMKSKKVIIIGVGETAELAYNYFMLDSDYEVVAFAADKEYIETDTCRSKPVVCIDNMIELYSPCDVEAFVAISSTKLNSVRKQMYDRIKSMGYRLASYISSHAYIGQDVNIGENCFILENNTIQSFVQIGDNVTLWSGNHIGHSSIVHNNCFVTSHVVISGFCEIGESCFIGVNSSIANNVKIGDFCLIGLGCIIHKDVESNSIMKMPYAQKQVIPAKKFFGLE